MNSGTDANGSHVQEAKKPYALLGAGTLTAAIWKKGDEEDGWSYRFNIFRMQSSTGRVSQLFCPSDVQELVKLCRVLALVLVDDGCISSAQRRSLAALAAQLEIITDLRGPNHDTNSCF
jgi:hypothetical protein